MEMIHQTTYHEVKSRWSYIADRDKLHLKIRVGKGAVTSAGIVAFDPYSWEPPVDGEGPWIFNTEKFFSTEMVLEHSDDHFDYWFGVVDDVSSLRIRYAFLLDGPEGSFFFGTKGILDREVYENFDYTGTGEAFVNFYNFPYLNEEDAYVAPEWVKDTVWYQIYPERFHNGNPDNDPEGVLPWNSTEQVNTNMYFGGDLAGITDKLDYIKGMGITGIYFTPMFKAFSDHKYDTEDYYQIDPSFGTNEEFGELVKEAHSRGIKVILDGVFNHCGWEHPFWQDVLMKGKDSEYYDCFHITGEPIVNFPVENNRPSPTCYADTLKLNYRTFAFVPDMPKWNTANAKVREHLIGVGKFWIEKYDVDGWRLDVSNEVSHDFWKDYRRQLQAVKKDIYLVGENWDSSYPWLQGDQFDAVMNYELLYSLWKFLGDGTHNTTQFDAKMFVQGVGDYLNAYPKPVLQNMFNLVDCHDTPRVMNVVNKDIRRAKLMYALQMFLPGSPSVYYGSEVGMLGDNAEHNRRCMPWEEQPKSHELYAHLKEMIALRSAHPAMKSTNLKWTTFKDAPKALILEKWEGEDRVWLMLNNEDREVTLEHPVTNEAVKLSAYEFRSIL